MPGENQAKLKLEEEKTGERMNYMDQNCNNTTKTQVEALKDSITNIPTENVFEVLHNMKPDATFQENFGDKPDGFKKALIKPEKKM